MPRGASLRSIRIVFCKRKSLYKRIFYYTYFYKRISFSKKAGAILKKIAIFPNGNAFCIWTVPASVTFLNKNIHVSILLERMSTTGDMLFKKEILFINEILFLKMNSFCKRNPFIMECAFIKGNPYEKISLSKIDHLSILLRRMSTIGDMLFLKGNPFIKRHFYKRTLL